MSDSNTPNRSPLKNNTHAFPGLKGDAEGGDNKSSDACPLFRPMFDNRRSSGILKRSGPQTISQPNREDALSLAGRRGYERGFTAGQSDGCELVQNELKPIIDDVKKILIQYDECRQRLTDIYSTNGLKLALAIVEKISGEPAPFNLEDLAEAGNLVRHALKESFGMNLHFNPQDYRFIDTMSACKSALDWSQYQQVAIAEDDTLEPGTVGCSAKQIEWDTIHKKVATALDKIMAADNNLQIE